jgi:hypothetical protein
LSLPFDEPVPWIPVVSDGNEALSFMRNLLGGSESEIRKNPGGPKKSRDRGFNVDNDQLTT